jgi:hypothetical protein
MQRTLKPRARELLLLLLKSAMLTVMFKPRPFTPLAERASRIDAWANGGANDICPAGFSVPTEAELAADTISANITGNASAFSSFLRIPVAGYRDRENGSVSSVRSSAYLWSRSANGVNGRGLNITVSIADFNSNNRCHWLHHLPKRLYGLHHYYLCLSNPKVIYY